jgi:hypothetical protein
VLEYRPSRSQLDDAGREDHPAQVAALGGGHVVQNGVQRGGLIRVPPRSGGPIRRRRLRGS